MTIERYEFGHLVVDGQSYRSDLILFPDHVAAGWRRRKGHELAPEDLREVIAARPEVLVVGTGYSGRMQVLPQTESLLREHGIRLWALPTREACRTYNQLCSEGVRAMAVLHLTC